MSIEKSIHARVFGVIAETYGSFFDPLKGPISDQLEDLIKAEVPPSYDLGDLAFPMFPLAKLCRKGPPVIAQEIASILLNTLDQFTYVSSVKATGPYVNVFYDKAQIGKDLYLSFTQNKSGLGRSKVLQGQKILVEFSSPNTNKPLHLGHLRNNALGESVSRILRHTGAEVKKVNLFNDRGIHICKSMLAYQRYAPGADPNLQGVKPDHFVAQLYVQYQNELKKQIQELKATNPLLAQKDDDEIWLETEIGKAAQDMLLAWEANDPKVRELWSLMNSWAIGGIMQTYARTGISFDWIQYEHETYMKGKAEALQGLKSGAFYKREDGAVVVDLPWLEGEKNTQKVILRSDGTSIYLTQDLGTALERHTTWPFDRAVYVVANEQDYHFKVLFYCLQKLGHDWASRLHHLSYGLVNLPSGRMKTREGTVVDADNLIDELASLALDAIKEKNREGALTDPQLVAEKVALAALQYYLIQASPAKDMIFNPEESLSFAGNTGPYIQYMGARISTMLQKAQSFNFSGEASMLWTEPQSWELVQNLRAWPQRVEEAAQKYDPSIVAGAIYEIAKLYSRFYHDLPILNAETPVLIESRVLLSLMTREVIKEGLELLNIPFLEAM